MANIIVRPGWFVPERVVTAEAVFFATAGSFLKQMGSLGPVCFRRR